MIALPRNVTVKLKLSNGLREVNECPFNQNQPYRKDALHWTRGGPIYADFVRYCKVDLASLAACRLLEDCIVNADLEKS